jgi:hypothetical protein
MDGKVLSASQDKPCARSGASAPPMLLRVAYQKSSRFWCRLIIGASNAPPKNPCIPTWCCNAHSPITALGRSGLAPNMPRAEVRPKMKDTQWTGLVHAIGTRIISCDQFVHSADNSYGQRLGSTAHGYLA